MTNMKVLPTRELSHQEQKVTAAMDAEIPFFVLSADDFLTVPTLVKYIKYIEDYGPRDQWLHEKLYQELNSIREWQTDNPEKVRFPHVVVSRTDSD